MRAFALPASAKDGAMAKVQVSTTLPVPAAAVWNMIGGFNELARCHPAVTGSADSREGGVEVRRMTLQGGGTVIERCERRGDAERTYSYAIQQSPLPVEGYRATLHVRAAPDGGSCTVEWSSEFESAGGPESEAARIIRSVYEAGFDNLRKLFGG